MPRSPRSPRQRIALCSLAAVAVFTGLAGPAAAQQADATQAPPPGTLDQAVPVVPVVQKDQIPLPPVPPALDQPYTPPPDQAPPSLITSPTGDWRIGLNGYLHGSYRWVQQPQNYNLAGRNNGFQLDQARLIVSVAWRRWLSLRVSVEGASQDRLSQSFPGGQLTTRLRDAYLTFSPWKALRITVGQIVIPWDLDSLRSDAALPFASRAVPVEGVQPTEGFTTRGMGADRSIGVSIHSGFLEAARALTVRYSLFVGNGNGQNQILNDNNLPAIYGRAELAYWGRRALPADLPGPMYAVTDLATRPIVHVGVAGQWVPRTVGNLPDLIRQTDVGAAADLAVNLFGVDLQAGLLYLRTQNDTLSAVPDLERFGWWGQLRYTIPKIPPELIFGYRIAAYQPRAHLSVAAPTPSDANFDGSLNLLYHTIGVSVRPLRGFPLRANLNYTFTTEQAPNQLDNDRFEADLVAVF